LRAASRALRSSANCLSVLGGSVLVGVPGGVDLDRFGTGASASLVLFCSILGGAGSWAFTPDARGIRPQNRFRQNARKQWLMLADWGARIGCSACSRGRFDILFFVPWRFLFSKPGERSVSMLRGLACGSPTMRTEQVYTLRVDPS
jgi:hypothetical protein